MTSPTVRSTASGSRNARSSRPFSEIAPTIAVEVVPVGRLGHRHLADPVVLERRDRLADALGRPGQDEVRQRRAVMAVGEQLGAPG